MKTLLEPVNTAIRVGDDGDTENKRSCLSPGIRVVGRTLEPEAESANLSRSNRCTSVLLDHNINKQKRFWIFKNCQTFFCAQRRTTVVPVRKTTTMERERRHRHEREEREERELEEKRCTHQHTTERMTCFSSADHRRKGHACSSNSLWKKLSTGFCDGGEVDEWATYAPAPGEGRQRYIPAG